LADRIVQRIALTLEYAVAFTRDAFALDNRVIADTVTSREPERRHRLIAFVDANVAAAWPKLAAAIEAYATARPRWRSKAATTRPMPPRDTSSPRTK